MTAERRAAVLAAINAIRAEDGAEPITELPKGIQGSVVDCVVARAIGHPCVSDTYYLDTPDERDGLGRPLPDELYYFIFDFDAGHIPELIDEAKPSQDR